MRKQLEMVFKNRQVFIFMTAYFNKFQLKVYGKEISKKEEEKANKLVKRIGEKVMQPIRDMGTALMRDYKEPILAGNIEISMDIENQKIIFDMKGTEEEVESWLSSSNRSQKVISSIVEFNIYDIRE